MRTEKEINDKISEYKELLNSVDNVINNITLTSDQQPDGFEVLYHVCLMYQQHINDLEWVLRHE